MYSTTTISQSVLSALTLSSLLVPVVAQTWTECNPLTQVGCPADPALGRSVSVDFTSGSSDEFTASGGPTYGSDGAAFTVARSGDSPSLRSNWYIMFGHVDFVVKAAPGTGIVSAAILQSDCLDEIDWEWLGGDNSQAQSNYFGKGITTTGYNRGAFHGAANNHDQYHTYSIDWTADQIVWSIDGSTVRAMTQSQAETGQYPQTPMYVKMGAWAGGDPSNPAGTVAWAGGYTDYTQGPFTMYVKTVQVTDYSTGTQYTYSGSSGTWESIESTGGSINSKGNGTPVSSGSAPAVTSVVPDSAPLGFGNNANSASIVATRTGYPWTGTATASVVTAASSQILDSSSGSAQASESPSSLTVFTSWDDRGFLTTVTTDAAALTAPRSYDSQGFLITSSPTTRITQSEQSASLGTATSAAPNPVSTTSEIIGGSSTTASTGTGDVGQTLSLSSDALTTQSSTGEATLVSTIVSESGASSTVSTGTASSEIGAGQSTTGNTATTASGSVPTNTITSTAASSSSDSDQSVASTGTTTLSSSGSAPIATTGSTTSTQLGDAETNTQSGTISATASTSISTSPSTSISPTSAISTITDSSTTATQSQSSVETATNTTGGSSSSRSSTTLATSTQSAVSTTSTSGTPPAPNGAGGRLEMQPVGALLGAVAIFLI